MNISDYFPWPDRPATPAEVAGWLRAYRDWTAELGSTGSYMVSPEGTRIQSNRTGRPTENAALTKQDVLARIRIVEQWMRQLGPVERHCADWYMRVRGRVTLAQIAQAHSLRPADVAGLVHVLPVMIWQRWYGGVSALEVRID